MKTIRSTLPYLLLLLLACRMAVAPGPAGTTATRPKNIILLVGDGMGITHVTVARILRGEEFQMGRMPVTGIITTHSADALIVDSAAAATALASGVKTNNRAVGVDASGTRVRTVLEAALEREKATGLVTTAAFFDATPAAFAAHAASRREGESIVRQMLSSGLDLVIGAGAERFGREGERTIEEVAELHGYEFAGARESIESASPGRLLAVFPTEEHETDNPEAPLPFLAATAIGRLSADPEGFFLVIEHEGIDGASHANATDNVLRSLQSFEQAIRVALDFAERDGQTLVIVTGDHETGAFEIAGGTSADSIELRWHTKGHTGQALPLFAYGPGSESFSGFYDNTDVARKLFALLGES